MKAFPGLPRASYGAILADPPWSFRTYGGDDVTPHRTEEDHYAVMSIDDICKLPVGRLALPDCALFLWAVDATLDRAFEVGRAWGFTYRTRAFEWIKVKKIVDSDQPGKAIGHLVDGDIGIGMGYWTRKQTESCLLFTKGKPPRLNADVRQIIIAPRREHSRKPDIAYERIERLVKGPYVELFARRYQPGWDGWGDEYV